ncbi:hypothetical protein D3H35_18375 [Cohnella faecalis]|uniref:Type II secretion system protein GspF domain-containing protein n=2 Tax=Cohnella faecalis TaxID=2315694 RepID=A0A398CIR7_9BACL|nr:hypothetical protein D3H35_18375 [Cohnella faecalis]
MAPLQGIFLLTALFFLLFVCFRIGIRAWLDRAALARRLHANRNKAIHRATVIPRTRFIRLHSHISDLLAAIGWSMRTDAFVTLSFCLGVTGATLGMLFFQSFRSSALLAAVLALFPYALLWMRLVSRQTAARLEFLPAVELFYQCYLVSGCRHVRTAVQRTVEERRLTSEVQTIFEQLYRNLSVQEDDEASLRRFVLSFGHEWADYFGNVLKVSLAEGNNVAHNLQELIADMRKAQLTDHQERHRLLEIRLANFSPILFLVLFLVINFRMNPESSYRYYVLDPAGRAMILNAVVLLFGSFLMGLYLSRRKM